MKKTFYSLILAAFFGMSGMQSWADDLTTTEIDGVTYYEIKNGEDLLAFAELVNGDLDSEEPSGQYNANAVLVNDIDMTGIVWENPIGVITGEDNGDVGPGAFTGIFDGQGHKITGFETESVGHGGLIGDANGATIKNFSISGTLTALGGHGSGVIAYPRSSTIYNVQSSMLVNIEEEAGACHIGGVVGSARGGNTISHCTFNGTLNIGIGSTDCIAGVVGYLGGDSVSFCANYGTINFEEQGCAVGGVAGYLNNATSYVQNCLNLGNLVFTSLDPESEPTPKWGGAIVGRLRTHDLAKLTGNVWLEGTATGAGKDNDGRVNLTQALCIDAAMLASGEACYFLNGDQTVIGWYQTLGTDEQPTFDATHAQVYMDGHKHCNGDLYEGYSFTNDFTEVTQDDHNMVDGVCDYCGFIDWNAIANSMELNSDGFYEIANGPQLMWFAKYVNNEHADANAILTADIDLSKVLGSNTWAPIGTDSFKGTFDGKGLTISNFNVTSNNDHYGLFGKLAGGAVVKNFTIYGTLNSLNQYVGVIGSAGGGTINISDIHSYLNITCSKSRHAGILGFQSSTGTINIDRCIYSGTLDAGTTVGNLGGIVGLTQNNANAYVNITDCLFDGTILDDGGSNAGGILGYANKTKVTIKNCLSVGTVIAPNPSPFIGQLNASNSKWAGKNYYTTVGELVGVPGNGVTVSGTEPEETSESQLASGEICWNLNGEKFVDTAWRQTLEEDPYPLPTGEGDYVYLFISGYDNINSENISEVIDMLSAAEKEFIEDEDLIAYQVLVNAYKAELESWEDITDIEEFLEAYRASAELKESIMKSVAKYKEYMKACNDAIDYIGANEVTGEWAELLQAYLQETLEPSTDYPNGTYAYIMYMLNLDDDALATEIDFVNQMLANAIAGGITAGTEVTRLLVNPAFIDGFEGWETESNGIAFGHGGNTDMHILRGLGVGTFNFYQSLAEMPNGIYMMTLNALFRTGSSSGNNEHYYNKFYAGQLYLNNTYNYVMSPSEDVIPEEDAEPGVNCLGEEGDVLYDDGDIVGFVPSGMTGCPVAFGAGRYMNFCATEITDGNLTVGVRSLGTPESDWLPFGNLHIYYLGTAEEADEKLAEVLEGYVARANTIVDFESSEDTYTTNPNMYNGLVNDLIEAIEAVEETEDKMALINHFSDLFNQVYASRMAYIAMLEASMKVADVVGSLESTGLLTEEEIDYWFTEADDALNHFIDGDVTTEEAIAITERLNGCDFMLNPVDGVYQLATPREVLIFSALVNNGETGANAVLTADIDFATLLPEDADPEEAEMGWTPIGSSDKNVYTGTFDGQGHSITGFYYNASSNWNGLFGYINNATIKNFKISGTLISDGWNYNGIVGQAEGTSVVKGIYSDMTVNVSNFKAHSGGIVGGCSTSSKILVEDCEFAGTLTHSGAGDCQAGILGYTYAGGVKNCVFSGTIIGENSKYGGILAYCKIPGFQGIQNCLSVGKIVAAENCTTAGAIIANWNGGATTAVKNNYYCMKEGSSENVVPIGNKASSCEAPIAVTTEQLASGEVCYKLNGDQSNIHWYQTLATDAYPVPFKDRLQVWLYDNIYVNYDPDAIREIPAAEPTNVQTGIYNLAGQRLQKMQKGINIVNGKKIFVK